MKKISALTALCIVIALMLPSFTVYAVGEGIDFRCYSYQSVTDALSDVEVFDYDDEKKNKVLHSIYGCDSSIYSEFFGVFDNLPSQYQDYDGIVISRNYYGPDPEYMVFFYDTSELELFVYNGYNSNPSSGVVNSTYDIYFKHIGNNANVYPQRSYYSTRNQTWGNLGGSWSSDAGYTYSTGFAYNLVYSTCPVYSSADYSYLTNNASFNRQWLIDNLDQFYDYSSLNENLSFVDREGSIVLPDPGVEFESNSNHMYFNNCDFGFCEPKGISSYNQFGGAYIYCRYVVDDWVVNHISDYSLQISMETLLDNQRYFRTLTYPLDRDGCLTLPFKNFGLTGEDNVTQGFVVVGNSNQTIDSDYFKVNLYSISTEQSKQEWFENASRVYNTLKAFDRYDTIDFYDIEDFYESNVVKYNKFTINLRAVLVSGEDNSGAVARSFNLVTGTDIATDTSGLDNDNPFEPDDTSEDFTPSLPSDSNTTVPSIIINTGGTWQGTFTGGFDPGYRDLKADLDADPDDNFTQYLAPFKNNEVGGFVGDFLDDMPTAMKSIFIGGFGVLTLLGIYRFIRRG